MNTPLFNRAMPPKKQAELDTLLQIIKKTAGDQLHVIILFGSYARGDWEEDIYIEDGAMYEYKSDFDLLLIGETKQFSENIDLKYAIEEKISMERLITTPVSLILENISTVNEALRQRNSFYCDVLAEGHILYDSKKLNIDTKPKPLTPAEKKRNAQEYFDVWTERATSALEGYNDYIKKYDEKQKNIYLNWAAFMLHQATEAYFYSILLVHTGYKPKTHDLAELNRKVLALDRTFTIVFPHKTAEQKQLFELLRKAYTEARFKSTYQVNQNQLQQMQQAVTILGNLNKDICRQKIMGMNEVTPH
jgi:predicted nucleotidyltransferase/HEPN domain-containing protein